MESEKPIKTSSNPFACFALHPKNLHFEDEEEDEYIVLMLRKHSVVIIPWILLGILLFLIPLIAYLLQLQSKIPVFNTFNQTQQAISVIVWYVLTFGFMFENFLAWYFHVYIVSNERIVDISFRGILVKRVTEARLDRIQDVSYKISGVGPILFNYGTVTIQTASEVQNINFVKVPNPSAVQRIIGDLIQGDAPNV